MNILITKRKQVEFTTQNTKQNTQFKYFRYHSDEVQLL